MEATYDFELRLGRLAVLLVALALLLCLGSLLPHLVSNQACDRSGGEGVEDRTLPMIAREDLSGWRASWGEALGVLDRSEREAEVEAVGGEKERGRETRSEKIADEALRDLATAPPRTLAPLSRLGQVALPFTYTSYIKVDNQAACKNGVDVRIL